MTLNSTQQNTSSTAQVSTANDKNATASNVSQLAQEPVVPMSKCSLAVVAGDQNKKQSNAATSPLFKFDADATDMFEEPDEPVPMEVDAERQQEDQDLVETKVK